MENERQGGLPADPRAITLKKMLVLALLFIVPVVGVLLYGLSRGEGGSASSGKSVDWGVYRQYDSATNKMSPELHALDGHKVRSPGFMVPLEDNRAEVKEFLLVPNPQACIHAPPPPSNQMIYVRMVGAPAKTMFGPVMVEGTLRVTTQTHQYGSASFQIYGENVDPYKGD